MTVARVSGQQAQAQTATAIASLSVTMPSAVTNGNLVALGVSAYNHNPGTTSVTDNQTGNTYTRDSIGNATDALADGRAAIYAALNVNASGTFTITYNAGSSQIESIYASEYSGVATSSAKDVGAAGGSGVSTNTPTTATTAATAQGDEVAIACLAIGNSNAVTITTTGTGWATVKTQGDGSQFEVGALSDNILTTTGTQVGTWSVSPAGAAYDACIQTYKGGISGPYVPPATFPGVFNLDVRRIWP